MQFDRSALVWTVVSRAQMYTDVLVKGAWSPVSITPYQILRWHARHTLDLLFLTLVYNIIPIMKIGVK